MGAIRIAAIDDHPVVLRGLGLLCSDDGHRVDLLTVEPTVNDFCALSLACDVVLLDLRLADGSRPTDNTRRLCDSGARVLVYSEGDRRSWIADALRAGAAGVVLKARPLDEVIAAIEAVHAGETWLNAEMADMLARDGDLRPELSEREIEVLQALSVGLADKQIARLIGVSEGTVKEYLKRIRAKYADRGRAAGSRVDLMRRALEDGYDVDVAAR